MSRVEDFAARIRERFPEALSDARHDLGSDVLVVRSEHLVEAARLLRDEFAFTMLVDLSGCDWLPRDPRFDVNYQLYDMAANHRVTLKVQLSGQEPSLPSVSEVWPTADWHEREVFDFFGITFTGHPDLRRIFMPDEWVGHPLRKDYPVGGVPVEYKIEPAYIGDKVVSEAGRPSAGGIPPRLKRDRGTRSLWTWTGPPASGVRLPEPPQQTPPEEGEGTTR